MQLPLDSIYISPKLQNKLDRIPSYPLTTVVAPAGYGKTTAVRWFCRRIPEEGTALRLGILGGGLSEFWHDLAETIGRAAGAPFAETMLKMGAARRHHHPAGIPAAAPSIFARGGMLSFY